MHSIFSKELIYVDDIVVYLKNERTGSSTIRKCKFVGQVVELTKTKVRIRRLSPPDIFVTPEEIKDFGIDTVYPDDVVHVIISKYDRDITKTLKEMDSLIIKYKEDKEELINWLLSKKYLIDEFDDTMTEEFERKHQWELSRNCFINYVIKHLGE